MISPFDRFALFFNCNLQHMSKARLQTIPHAALYVLILACTNMLTKIFF